ncbi:MAG: fibronectin type III domain-containing protein [Treponema sp.]|jgi:hypothetical protein|nr:fibronectin type III domain-containing protein [Treponema sp.]
MTNKKGFLRMFVTVLALGLVLLGCPTEEESSGPAKYKVTFDVNGGALTSGALTQDVEDGKTAAVPVVAPPAGKEADGWISSVALIASPASPITADVTFTARWKDPAPVSDAPVVTVTPGDGQLDISWTAVTGETGGYKVYIRTSTTAPDETNLVAQTAAGVLTYKATTATNSNNLSITNRTTYYVWVRAVKGTGFSDLSEVKEGTPMEPDAKPVKPAAPVITSLPSGQLKITWTAVATASGYDVVVSENDTSPSNNPDDPGADAHADRKWDVTNPLEFTTTLLSSSTQYYVFVRAKNVVGTGSWCDAAPMKTAAPVASVVGGWNMYGGGSDTLTFTEPNTCLRSFGVGNNADENYYTYEYNVLAAGGDGVLVLTPQGGGTPINGTVTGNVLTIPFGGVTKTYTKQQ